MKAISLWQPWATAVALGLKQVETRSWRTHYRGPIAICAAKCAKKEVRHAFDRAVGHLGYGVRFCAAGYTDFEDLPLGAIVATANLVACVSVDAMEVAMLPDEEKAWGNYARGRFAWYLKNVRRLDAPVPCVGGQGFFEVSTDVVADAFAASLSL